MNSMGYPSLSHSQEAAVPSGGAECFSVYSSPAKSAARPSSRSASPTDEKENVAPAGTPPPQRWHETADFSRGSPDSSEPVQRSGKPAGGKLAPSDKAARRPLRNITPLLVRKASKLKLTAMSKDSSLGSRQPRQVLGVDENAGNARQPSMQLRSGVQTSMRSFR